MEKRNTTKTAEDWKEEGNNFFRDTKYIEALEAYSKAIELDATNHIYYTNRSTTYAYLWMGDKALKDADKAIEINPEWIRGYLRRSRALIMLGRVNEAILCLEKASELNADDSQIKTALLEARERAEQMERDGIKDMQPPKPDFSEDDFEVVRRVLSSKTYYEILQVTTNAVEDEIKTNYRRLARLLHPDKNRAPQAADAMKLLSEAHQTLTDEFKRGLYDRYVNSDAANQTSYAQWEAENADMIYMQQALGLESLAEFIRKTKGLGCLLLIILFIICLPFIILTCIICCIAACCILFCCKPKQKSPETDPLYDMEQGTEYTGPAPNPDDQGEPFSENRNNSNNNNNDGSNGPTFIPSSSPSNNNNNNNTTTNNYPAHPTTIAEPKNEKITIASPTPNLIASPYDNEQLFKREIALLD
eukprot:TRINITY_DN2014_c1_g1_i1.p1 TRINITY_DN2014_c1_g1~~TRINITY_DN2014_c1_g1_i1.p1  ORF type:complete len:418 (-),score=222.37 TRINITY_DN2014_c1_g1_i1:51-1304(-)